jgi:hypothetical protein
MTRVVLGELRTGALGFAVSMSIALAGANYSDLNRRQALGPFSASALVQEVWCRRDFLCD